MPGVPRDATALVLAGGGSRRFGGDKLAQSLGGTTVLDVLLSSLPGDWPVVVVGPQRVTVRTVGWATEDEPDGGPVAGVAAGLPSVTSEIVVVLAGDLPFAGPGATRLAGALAMRDDVDVLAVRDGDGRLNPLFAAYRLGALSSVLPDEPRNAAARALLARLRHDGMEVAPADLLDVDTPEALELARRRLGG